MYQSIDRTNVYDSIFHMLTLETINYILKKTNIDSKQKLIEIEEIGNHLGERIANHLQNNNSLTGTNSSTKMEVDDVMKFLGRDVWLFLFGKQIAKLQTNRKGTFLIDVEELKFHHSLISEKTPLQEEILENILAFVSGIIKGVLGAFNIECNVTAGFKSQVIVANLLSMSLAPLNGIDKINISGVSSTTTITYPYSFTISLLNLNIN